MNQKFKVTGMTCSACSSHVEKAVRKLDGVEDVNVNLLTNSMQVEYDNNKIKDTTIIDAVKQAGYGAELPKEATKIKKSAKEDKKEEIKQMKHRVLISFLFLIPLMYIAMGHMIGLPIPNILHGTENALNFAFTQFLLTIPIVYVNRKYYQIGFKTLIKRAPNMDSLIAIGSSAALVYGIYAIYKIGYGLGHGMPDMVMHTSMHLYFESAAMILTLITLGKYLETRSKGKTTDAINKLIDLSPKTATVIRQGEEIKIVTEEIIVGDIVVVKPGERIPVDGEIIEGSSYVDQSAITGESIPIKKEVGDKVISATINKSGSFKFKAEKVGEDTTLAQIIQLVEEASSSKAPISKLADKVSGIFVPVVITIAILSAIFWIITGQSFEFALSIGIAVLVISCPCALGLATPVSIMVATGKAAENGILIKSAESLEVAHLINTVVLDKTGTITLGKPQVTDIEGIGQRNKEEILKIAASIEKNSEHPLGNAIVERAKQQQLKLEEISDFLSIHGRGIKAKLGPKQYLAGNKELMIENDIMIENVLEKYKSLSKEGKTTIFLAEENEIIGMISISDVIKPSSIEAIENLKRMQIEVIMLTGDNRLVAEAIAKQAKVDKVISDVMPQDKEKQIRVLQEQGKKVAMVGDGINDSPAITRADVGIAIGAGTDIAIESADIVLIKNNLMDVVTAIDLSRHTIKNIKMNLFWAFFYNIIGIPLAAGVLYPKFGLILNPMIAALAMSLSSVCVITNALRLRAFKPKQEKIVKNKKEEEREMEKEIKIEGMSCNHCKMAVEKALNGLEGVTKAEVNLEEKKAKVIVKAEVKDEVLKQTIEEAGYEVIEIK